MERLPSLSELSPTMLDFLKSQSSPFVPSNSLLMPEPALQRLVVNALPLINLPFDPPRVATLFCSVVARVLARLLATSVTAPPSTIPTPTMVSNHTSDPRDVSSKRPVVADPPTDLRFKVFALVIQVAAYNLNYHSPIPYSINLFPGIALESLTLVMAGTNFSSSDSSKSTEQTTRPGTE
jgi:hypothetical protein